MENHTAGASEEAGLLKEGQARPMHDSRPISSLMIILILIQPIPRIILCLLIILTIIPSKPKLIYRAVLKISEQILPIPMNSRRRTTIILILMLTKLIINLLSILMLTRMATRSKLQSMVILRRANMLTERMITATATTRPIVKLAG